MSIQQCRMVTLASRIGRQANAVRSSRSIVSSRFWNQKSSQNLVSPSIRQYAMLAEAPPVVSSPSQLVVPRMNSHNFFFSDLVSSLVPAAKETTTTSNSILSWAIWLIKRTYQPSLLKKKRQCGYMKRKQTVGGRRILKRRRKKGRKRLFGA